MSGSEHFVFRQANFVISELAVFIFNLGIFIIYLLCNILSHSLTFLISNLSSELPAPKPYNFFSENEIDAINCTSGVLVIGSSGVGKSTLLNTLIGEPVFSSGFSPATGLTQTLQAQVRHGTCYIDTPGMGGRKDQKDALSKLNVIFRLKTPLKIIFLVVLQSGRVRKEDTLLIEAALDRFAEQQCVGKASHYDQIGNNFGVIVNQMSPRMLRAILRDSSAEQALHCVIARKYKTNHWLYLPEASRLTHARNATSLYPDNTKNFVSNLRALE